MVWFSVLTALWSWPRLTASVICTPGATLMTCRAPPAAPTDTAPAVVVKPLPLTGST